MTPDPPAPRSGVAPDGREIIPADHQPMSFYKRLLPIAKFLIEERGHLPIEGPDKYGFHMGDGGYVCYLTREITAADWDAINQHFVIPENIGYHAGLLRDFVTGIDIIGTDFYIGDHGRLPIEDQEAEIRERDAKLDPPPYRQSAVPPA